MLMAVPRCGIPQEEIIYALVSWDVLKLEDTYFSDGNARANETLFYQGIENLNKIDFNAVKARYWGDKGAEFKRCKQAEVLRRGCVLLSEIKGFVVYNDAIKIKVETMLNSSNVQKKVFVVREYYY